MIINEKRLIIVSELLPDKAIERLEGYGSVIKLPADTLIPSPVSSHPDMILAITDKKLFCHTDYYEKNREVIDEIGELSGLEVYADISERRAEYPFDVAYNVLVCGEYVVANPKTASKELLTQYEKEGKTILETNQGYTGCSSLYADGTVITADKSVLKAVKGHLNTLELAEGDITLNPYDTGFIGGASGYCNGTLFLMGDIDSYCNCDIIKEYINKNGIGCVSLLDGKLSDFGGIKFIDVKGK